MFLASVSAPTSLVLRKASCFGQIGFRQSKNPTNLCRRHRFQTTVLASVATSSIEADIPKVYYRGNNNYNNHKQGNNGQSGMMFMPAVAVAAAVGASLVSSNRADCCGIVGVVGTGNYDARLVFSFCFSKIFPVSDFQ